jgi:hypothetical protein
MLPGHIPSTELPHTPSRLDVVEKCFRQGDGLAAGGSIE